jgi:hypothetical protein
VLHRLAAERGAERRANTHGRGQSTLREIKAAGPACAVRDDQNGNHAKMALATPRRRFDPVSGHHLETVYWVETIYGLKRLALRIRQP